MADTEQRTKPKTFFLNEQHELVPGEVSGFGKTSKYPKIDWQSKGKHIHSSLENVKKRAASSKDPLKDRRYFMMTMPTAVLEKESKNKKIAPDGFKKEKTEYGGTHSKIFRRLGMDLLQVHSDGSAVVHATPDKIQNLLLSADTLPELGPRERIKWATIESFAPIPQAFRIDEDWVKKLPQGQLIETIIELQPLLTGVEADEVLRVLAATLKKEIKERFLGTGTDFSGRQWARGSITRESLSLIAKEFFSVQSVHPPLSTLVAAAMPAPTRQCRESSVPRGNRYEASRAKPVLAGG